MKWSASKFLRAKNSAGKWFQNEAASWHGTPAPLPFKLPVELIYAIIECEELTTSDLQTLRYVCKSFAELVAPRLFSTLSLDFVYNRLIRRDPSPPRIGSRNASPSRIGKPRSRKVSLSSLFRSKPSEPERPPSPVYETIYPVIDRLEALLKDPTMKHMCKFPRKLVVLADKHKSGDDEAIGIPSNKTDDPRKTAVAFKKFCEEHATPFMELLENLQVVEYHVSNDDYMRGSDGEFTHVDPEEFRPEFGRFLLLLSERKDIKVKATYTITIMPDKFRVEDVIPRSSAGENLASLSLFFRSEEGRSDPVRGYRDRLDKAAKRIAMVISSSPNLKKLAFMSECTNEAKAPIGLDSVICAIPETYDLKLKKLKIPWEEITMSEVAVNKLRKLEELELSRYFLTHRRDSEHAKALNEAWHTFAENGVMLSSIKAAFTGDQGMVDYLKSYGNNYSEKKLRHLQFDVPYAHDTFSTLKTADNFEDFAAAVRTEIPQPVWDNLEGLHVPSFRNKIKPISKMLPEVQIYLEHWDVKKLTFSSTSLKHFSGLLLIDNGRSFDKFFQTLKDRPKLQTVNLVVVPTWWRDPKHNIDRFATLQAVAKDSWRRMGRAGVQVSMEVFTYEDADTPAGGTMARVGKWHTIELPSGNIKSIG